MMIDSHPDISLVQLSQDEETSAETGAEKIEIDRTSSVIIVTARRREEKPVNVPISLSVISRKDIARSGLRDFTDLQYLVPGLNYADGVDNGLLLRGIGTRAVDLSVEQAVGFVVDNIGYDAPGDPNLLNFEDVKQVEVLRGPQGTLFGKNATAGLVSITTNNPDPAGVVARLAANYGGRGGYAVRGTVNLPLGPSAAFRVAAFAQGEGGYGRNVLLNRSIGAYDDRGVRAKLLVEPASDLSILFSVVREHHSDNSPLGTLIAGTPAFEAASIQNGIRPGPNNFDIASPRASSKLKSSTTLAVEANYRVGVLKLISLTSYRRVRADHQLPADLVPAPLFLTFNDQLLSTETFSQEFRLNSSSSGALQYVVGAFYRDRTTTSELYQWGKLAQPLPDGILLSLTGVPGTATNQNDQKAHSTTEAIFGDVSVSVGKLTLSAGGRYTRDRNSHALRFTTRPTHFFLSPIYSPPAALDGKRASSNFSYRVNAAYHLFPEGIAYIGYSTGYKASGVAFLGSVRSFYGEETAASYEAGIKANLWGGALSLNGAAFLARYKNFQEQVLAPQPFGPPQFIIDNAGSMRSWGFEGDVRIKLSPGFGIRAAVSYADAVYIDFDTFAGNFSGLDVANAPKWSVVGGADYSRRLGDWVLEGNFNLSWRSATYALLANPSSRLPPYMLADVRIGVRFPGNRLSAGAYIRNVFDQRYRSGYYDYIREGVGLVAVNTSRAFRSLGVYIEAAY